MSVRSVGFLRTSYVLVEIVAFSKSEDLRGLKLCYQNISGAVHQISGIAIDMRPAIGFIN